MPASSLSRYSLRYGGSVPSCWVTLYWIGESFFWSSESLGLRNGVVTLRSPFTLRAGACADARVTPAAAQVAVRASSRARRARPGRYDIMVLLENGRRTRGRR